MTPAGGRGALQKEKGAVRTNTQEERGEEEEEEGDAASRIPSGRLRRRGRS